MNILEYVKENYKNLPKSTFNGDECVIIKEITNENEGWGHHSYEGIGIDVNGNLCWCYSSGCSCNGSCGMDHTQDIKFFNFDTSKEDVFEINTIDYNSVNFNNIQVEFSDY